MKIAIVALCLVAAVAAIPVQQQQTRLIRDVSEIVADPVNEYLPPAPLALEPQVSYLAPPEQVEVEPVVVAEPVAAAEEETEIVAGATEAVPETAVLGENGYEYRNVRRLRLRQRRDVSHLNLGYLPPVVKPRVPSTYLPPPQLDVPQELPQLKISNEYLPPVTEESVSEVPQTEAAETEAPTTEASTTEAPTTETPTTAAPTTDTPPTTKSAAVETAVLAEHGYHYRKPAVFPDLGISPVVKVAEPDTAPAAPELQPEAVQEVVVEAAFEPEQQQPAIEQVPEPEQAIVAEPELAYLPPLEQGVVEAEGPGQETAALLDDGYHYRVVKRVRLF